MSVYSIAEITTFIKLHLENEPVLRNLSIKGEVSNATVSAAGHVYFTLKDTAAQIRCVMFRPQRNRHLVEAGVSLIAHGSISIYEARGDLQFYVEDVVSDGSGALAAELEALRSALEAEGLFEPSRKRSLPPFPRAIGVVTSVQGAVLHDIQNVLRRRYPLTKLRIAPTTVQGQDAVTGVLESIQKLNREPDIDVIIIARGGGSLEDLAAFNDERVVRAIHGSKTPIVSGIGHETDTTLSDMAADVRAPTPSAAAEVSVPSADNLLRQIIEMTYMLGSEFGAIVSQRSQSIQSARSQLESGKPQFTRLYQQIDDLLQVSFKSIKANYMFQVEAIHSLRSRLETLNPDHVLGRGYSVVTIESTGEVIKGHKQVTQGSNITATTHDGTIHAMVTKVSPVESSGL
jgi:exodeoxyribonuclease VII large subunit